MSITIQDAIARGEDRLRSAGIENPRLAVEMMLRKILGFGKVELHLQARSVVDPQDEERLEMMIERKLKREPLQHILGETEWYGLTLKCDARALVPRPETEIIVEKALERIRSVGRPRVADIGTGSGCIAIAVAAERPDARIVACDNSPEALALAQENVEEHHPGERIDLVEEDLKGFLKSRGRFDLIISNPPYIRESEYTTLMPEVRKYEPRAALVAGEDGLDAIREIVKCAPDALNQGGWLALEFGVDHAEPVRALLKETGRFAQIEIMIDYNQRERGIVAQLKVE